MVELQFYTGIVGFGNGIFPVSRSAIQNGIVSTMKDFCSGESAFSDKYVKPTERPEDSLHAYGLIKLQERKSRQ